MRPLSVARTLMALGTILALAACTTVYSPRRSSDAPGLRCLNDPGRGESPSPSRPLFFLVCAQSP